MKIGIFGGSFNPPHSGHLNVVSSVMKKMGLDRVMVIPNHRNPLKQWDGDSEALPIQRLEMARLAFKTLGAPVEVRDLEITRSGPSFTVDTLKVLKQEFPKDKLYLIIGVDNLARFTEWKDWEQILAMADLIVTTRPGWDMPTDKETLPDLLQDLVHSFEFNLAELKTGHTIHFLNLKDVTVSSTEIRRQLQIGKATSHLLTLDVENYAKQNNVYPLLSQKVDDYQKLTFECIQWLADRKALNVRAFDLAGLESISDYAIVASGTSTKHVSSIADYVKQEIKKQYNILPQATEGMIEGKWVVLDYGVLVVHVFYEYVRQAYALEQLWSGAHEIAVPLPSAP